MPVPLSGLKIELKPAAPERKGKLADLKAQRLQHKVSMEQTQKTT